MPNSAEFKPAKIDFALCGDTDPSTSRVQRPVTIDLSDSFTIQENISGKHTLLLSPPALKRRLMIARPKDDR
jgi:hypothetical protein